MADDLTMPDSVATEPIRQPVPAAPPVPVIPHRPPLYGKRFALAYALLAVLLGTAAGLAYVMAEDGAATKERAAGPWSTWQPSSKGTTPRVKEITEHVAERYRLDSGRQLVSVTAGPLAVQGDDGSVAVTDVVTSTGSADGDVFTGETGGGAWMFNMCGLGERCAITEGTASVDRHRLLRREALELALFSFKYVDSIQSVVAFLPPPPDAQQSQNVVYLRRQDVQGLLEKPLPRSILPLSRVTPSDLPPTEAEQIDAITEPRTFNFEFRPTPTGGAALVLHPVA